jgi:hypothetical protein
MPWNSDDGRRHLTLGPSDSRIDQSEEEETKSIFPDVRSDSMMPSGCYPINSYLVPFLEILLTINSSVE